MPERFKRPDPRAIKDNHSKSRVKGPFVRTWDFGTGVGTVHTTGTENESQEQAPAVKPDQCLQ